MNLSVVGGGSWGSAFALYLGRSRIRTRLWIREPEIFETAVRERENKVFLPGFRFPEEVTFHRSLEETVSSSPWVFVAVPSQFCRRIYSEMAPHVLPDQVIVSLTKGIEKRTLCRMSEVMADVFPPARAPKTGVLSGPSFSREVALGLPTALVLASRDTAAAKRIQQRLSGPLLRIYTTGDVTGVEIAGALKNVIAIAAGMNDSLRFGDNARASLITRGLAEITRLGLKLGARRETFFGLAGVGDLILTCAGSLSRNRFVGAELGRGKSLSQIIAGMKMVAEGIATTISTRRLAQREGVEMPISEQVYQILSNGKDPKKAIADLMLRSLKGE